MPCVSVSVPPPPKPPTHPTKPQAQFTGEQLLELGVAFGALALLGIYLTRR